MNLLVSIIVITYNSSKYILDTLESVLAQDYKNIELIISDDCSVDDTIIISRKWMIDHKSRFVNVKIVESKINLGIPNNCNKGILAANGMFVKLIAGDDILYKDCISNNVNYSKKYNVNFLVSKVKEIDKYGNILKNNRKYNLKFFNSSAKKQHEKLLLSNCIDAPTFFFNKSKLEEVGLYDEKYKYMEDYPQWLNITDRGCHIDFMDVFTVYYRVHHDSVTSSNNSNRFLNEKLYYCKKMLFDDYLSKELISRKRYLVYWDKKITQYYCERIIKKGNKKSLVSWTDKLILLCSPLGVINKIKKVFLLLNEILLKRTSYKK